MSIRHRITLLIMLAFLSLAGIGGYAVYQTRGSAAQVKEVTEGVVPSALASADVVALVKDVQLATMALVYAPDAALVAQSQAELKDHQAALSMALASQAEHAHTQAQRGLVEQARESFGNYAEAIRETAEMKAAGRDELAQAFLFANVARYRDEMEKIVQTLRVEKNREKDEAITALNGLMSTTTTAIGVVSGIAVLLLVGVGMVLYRQIARPLTRMQAMMSEIADSQDFSRRVPVGSADEIGRSIIAFNSMIERIQENAGLLRQKTTDMQAILQNMQQGILTVVPGAVVHPEYSKFLEQILETHEIEGRHVMELIFAHSDISAELASQVDAAIDACLGQDLMNFDFNEHLLVKEVTRRMPDGSVKVLDLSWSPITDEHDNIVRLMLCLRDVTQLRKLAAEASEQKQDLEIIGEILAVNEASFSRFMESAVGFARENERILRQNVQADIDAVNALFRNMHTVKGNARTHQFRHIAEVAHEIEQSYDSLRSAAAQGNWDKDRLLDELERVHDALGRYAMISESRLGRSMQGGGSAVGMPSADEEAIRATLALVEQSDPTSLRELAAMRDAVHRNLSCLGTVSVDHALSGVIDSLPSLATELGKAAPAVQVNGGGQRVVAKAGAVLTDVFTHLFRNALDHGIEQPDVRRLEGKPAAGRITVDVITDEQGLRVTLADDGRGLSLGRIRSIAIARGWLQANQACSDAELAQFIFRAGFSTAQNVTAVSGRGVGMEAVLAFLQREGGNVSLHFTDDSEGATFRPFETIVRLPQRYIVDAAGLEGRHPQADRAAVPQPMEA
ncbi:HAMP domain-containing protein [Cupriavidus necator]|uniref:Chemotaxis protein CheA n=1 Tax=Cupriavidus pinatubonensis (strain JMP 134 / LMG 1197) TaxID=264198 RepID=Q46ZW1_CUPPJ|nr:HAMP domain-containing protein [Cupriavidus necator]